MVWTKYVFPSIRIVIWAIIAAALVKIAFGAVPDNKAGQTEIVPGSDFSAEAHTVANGSIKSYLTVPASVVADPAVDVKPTTSGKLGYWAVSNGSQVVADQAVAEIRTPIMSKPSTDEDGNVVEPYDTGFFTREVVYAPISGKVTYVAELNDEVTKATVLFSVAPGTLSIEGDLTPQDRYKLVENPKQAKIQLEGGPEAFTCKRPVLGTDLVEVAVTPELSFDEETGEEITGPTEGSAVKVTCEAPKKIRLFAGLSGSMTIPIGEVSDAVVVPTSAVQAVGNKGRIWILDQATGEESARDVKLGITDGKQIEVVEGLKVGESIRLYAPIDLEAMQEDGVEG